MKKYIDNNIYDFILKTLKENDINDEIIKIANKMDVDLPNIFYEKILCVNNVDELSKNVDVVAKSLLGIYGNYLASYYYKKLGYDVENEYEIKEGKKIITKADIAFTNHEGDINLCEVKATPQIIDNVKNYNSIYKKECDNVFYLDMDSDIIKYKEIGNKLIKQVSKLTKTKNKVTVIIFEGCFIDDAIKDKLKAMGASIFTLAVNINELENHAYDIVYNVMSQLKSINNDEKMISGK